MTGHRTRLSLCLALLALLALTLPGGLHAAAQGPAPAATATTTVFLPVVGVNFPSPSTAPSVRFWAERYTLDQGACTMLHWTVTGAKTVVLDGVGVAAAATRSVCPAGTSQFYTLEVQGNTGDPASYMLVLMTGDPMLEASQVIAQGTVQAVAAAADVDPATPGNQAGYEVQLKDVVRLYSKDAGWNQAAVTLAVPQSLIDFGFSGPVHWPLKAGQQVEFRANCDGATCAVVETAPTYLYLRSE